MEAPSNAWAKDSRHGRFAQLYLPTGEPLPDAAVPRACARTVLAVRKAPVFASSSGLRVGSAPRRRHLGCGCPAARLGIGTRRRVGGVFRARLAFTPRCGGGILCSGLRFARLRRRVLCDSAVVRARSPAGFRRRAVAALDLRGLFFRLGLRLGRDGYQPEAQGRQQSLRKDGSHGHLSVESCPAQPAHASYGRAGGGPPPEQEGASAWLSDKQHV